MDNKQDKQFYWEVKQFLSNNQTPAPKPKSIGLNDISKMILESNNPYRTSSLHQDINSHDVIGQVMNYLGKENNKKALNSAAHKKITHTNPFAMLKEGIFDAAISSAKRAVASASLSSVPRQAASSSSAPQQSFQLPDGTWVDQYGNPIPGSPLPGGGNVPTSTTAPGSAPSSAPTPGSVPGGASTTSVPSGMASLGAAPGVGSSVGAGAPLSYQDKIDNLLAARAMRKGDGDGRSPEARAENKARREARNAAVAAATIALRQDREAQKEAARQAREDAVAAARAAEEAARELAASARQEAGPMPSGTGGPVSVSSAAAKKAEEAAKRAEEAKRKSDELRRQREKDERLISPPTPENLARGKTMPPPTGQPPQFSNRGNSVSGTMY